MKSIIKYIAIILIFIFSFSIGFSEIIQDDVNTRAYFNFTNAGLDATGRFTTITATGTPNQVTGIIGQGFNFDGTSENFDIGSIPVTAFPFTLNAWVNSSGDKPDGGVIAIGDASATNVYFFLGVNNGFPRAAARNGGGQPAASATTDIGTGQWFMITGVFNSATDRRIYVNAVNEANNTDSITFNAAIDQTSVGQNADVQTDQFFAGVIDEPSIWNKSLNQDEINQLYQSGNAFGWNFVPPVNPAIFFDNVTMDNVTNFNNTIYNVSSINLEVNLSTNNTNNNVNVTFFLYNSTGNLINTTQFMTNSLNGDLDIVFPSEGTFQFFLNASNNETNTLSPSSGNFTIRFDETPPSLVVNLPTEYGFYDDFNFSNFITVSDDNLLSCVVTIFNQTATTCTNTSYSFQFNGNATINVTATDTAGNVNSSLNNIMLINPVQNFFFQTGGVPITNFTFGGLNFNTSANISTYGSIISIGSNTLLFERLGVASTNVTFIVNLTSRINLTTNISASTIVLRIFDRETLALLTGLTTITLEATTGFNGTTTTGLLNISNINFINEQYQILAEHVGYSPETVFFDYNNQETIAIDIFMLNATATDAGTITIIVKNTLSQLVESAICSALEWRPAESAFVSVAQGLTNVNGETRLNIELNTKIYEFSCTKDTFTTVTNAQIVQIDGSELSIILNDIFLVPTTLFPNLITSLINSSINSTHQLVTYTFADSDGLTTEGCVQSFFVNGNRETFDQETCVSTPTGVLLLTVNINQTSDILIKGVLTTPDITDYVTNTLTFKGTGDIAFQLARFGLDIIIPTTFALLGLGLGILLLDINIGVILMAVGGWLAVALVPSVMSGATATFITMLVGLMIWGGYVRK